MRNTMTRRRLLGLLAGAVGGTGISPVLSQSTGKTPVLRSRLGVCIDSYGIARGSAGKVAVAGFRDALAFLEFCHQRGAGGIQIRIDPGMAGGPAKLRSKAESYGMYVEGQGSLPGKRVRSAAIRERGPRGQGGGCGRAPHCDARRAALRDAGLGGGV